MPSKDLLIFLHLLI